MVRGSKSAAITLSVFIVIYLLAGLALLSAGIWMSMRGKERYNIATQLSEVQKEHLVSLNDFVYKRKQPAGAISYMFNYIFVAFGCCGLSNAEDARLSQSWQNSNRTWVMKNAMVARMFTPAACCPVQASKKSELLSGTHWSYLNDYLVDLDCPITGVGIHKDGCVDAVLNFIERYAISILIGCGVFAVAQLLVLIFILCMIC